MAYEGNYAEIPDWYPDEGQTMEPGNDDMKKWEVGYKPPAQWRNWQDKGWFLALKAIDQALADHEAKKGNTHNVGEGNYIAKTSNPNQYPRRQEIVGFEHGNEEHTEDFETETGAQEKANTAENNAKKYIDSHAAKTSGVHGVGNSEVASKDWVNGKLNAQIAVIDGTINHGEILPLPAGYAENECHWIVSVVRTDMSGDATGNNQGCHVDSNRRVIVEYKQEDKNWQTGGKANYLVIGVKK